MNKTTDQLHDELEEKRQHLNRLLAAGAPKSCAVEYNQTGLEFEAIKSEIARRERLLRPAQ